MLAKRALSVSAVTMIATAVLPVAAANASPYCDPGDSRTYTQVSTSWYRYDGGTLSNGSAGTISKTYTHSSNASLTTTVSAEVGAKVSTVVAEVNAKLGVSASVTASYTTSTSFTVSAPPHTTVTYKDGILIRNFSIKHVHLYTNCTTGTTYGTAKVADNYSRAS